MKTKITFILVAVAFLISSCGSDDDSTQTSPIVGTWKPISQIHEETQTGETTNEHSVCDNKTRVTFNLNNTMNASVFYGDNLNNCSTYDVNNASWELSGNKLKVVYNFEDGAMNTTVTFSNSNNTMTDVSIDGPYVITTIYSRVN